MTEKEIMEVGKEEDVHTGKASIRTVVSDNNVEEFDINILTLNLDSETKNILFEITDKELLEKTGGVIQGMSGSPIKNKMLV